VFFGRGKMEGVKEAGLWLVIPAVVLALITLGVGVFFPVFINTIIVPITSLF